MFVHLGKLLGVDLIDKQLNVLCRAVGEWPVMALILDHVEVLRILDLVGEPLSSAKTAGAVILSNHERDRHTDARQVVLFSLVGEWIIVPVLDEALEASRVPCLYPVIIVAS